MRDLYAALEQGLETGPSGGILTPEMAAEFPDLVADMQRHPSLQERWAGYIVRQAQVQAIQHATEQLEIWRAHAELGPRGYVDGLGEQVAAIAPGHMNFMCWKDGPNWFRDNDLLQWTLRRHPEMRVKSGPARPRIYVDGFRDRGKEQEQEQDFEGRDRGAGNGARENPPGPPMGSSFSDGHENGGVPVSLLQTPGGTD